MQTNHYGGYEAFAELAELYDRLYLYNSRKDISFYVNLCKEISGEVLELGCGTGRVLIPAAEAGCAITGLDRSANMLGRCRAKVALLPEDVQERIRLVQADMTRFHLKRQFSLVIVPFRPIQHLLTVDQQLKFLRCAADHVEPGGHLVFDVFHVDPARLAGPVNSKEVEDTPETRLEDGRSLRRTFRLVSSRRSEQCNDIELIYYVTEPAGAVRRMVQAFPLRYFYRYELEHLLVRAGLRVTHLYGDFDRSPFTDESPEMIVTAVVAGRPNARRLPG